MKRIKNIAIITARKGSKRIKNKNIKKFLGKPIIYYSIKILQKTKLFDEIIVSTNCEITEKLSKKYGVNRIIKRPDFLSSNQVGTIRVINHSINYLSKMKISPQYICCMYPAAPLTRHKNIISAFKYLKRNKNRVKFIYPSTNLITVKTKIKNNNIDEVIKIKSINKKKGIINNYLLDAGQFWFADLSTWKKSRTIYLKKSCTFEIPEPISDINTLKDWGKVLKIFKKINI